MTFDWIKLGGILAVIVGVVMGGVAVHHHIYNQGYTAGAAHVQAEFDAAKKAAEEKRLADVQAARAEEQRRTAAQTEIANEATKRSAADAAAATAATASADQLRARVDQLVRTIRAASHPAAPSPSTSESGGDPLDVLVDVLDRTESVSGQLATYADKLKTAGLACEADYDALTPARAGN